MDLPCCSTDDSTVNEEDEQSDSSLSSFSILPLAKRNENLVKPIVTLFAQIVILLVI